MHLRAHDPRSAQDGSTSSEICTPVSIHHDFHCVTRTKCRHIPIPKNKPHTKFLDAETANLAIYLDTDIDSFLSEMSWSYFQRYDNYGISKSVWQKKSFKHVVPCCTHLFVGLMLRWSSQRSFRWAVNYHGCGIRWRLYHFNLKYSVEKDKLIQ